MINLKNRLFLLLLIMSFGMQAQIKIKRQGKEKIQALKIAYLTDKLDFTEKEAERFWPIYNKFDKKLMELRTAERYKIKKALKDAGGIEAISEDNAKMIIREMIALEKEIYHIKKAFFDSLKKVIASKKIIQLQIAEREFNRSMLRRLRKYK